MNRGVSMKLQTSIAVTGLERVQRLMQRLSSKQLNEALARGLMDGAFRARRAMIDEMDRVFKNPSPYLKRSINWGSGVDASSGARISRSQAYEQNLQLIAERLWVRVSPRALGGDGVDPQKILEAQAFGGTRRDKRVETVLRAARLLPSGYQVVLPFDPIPGSVDARGDFNGTWVRQVLSYLNAFSNAGSQQNMSARRRRRIERGRNFEGPLRKRELPRLHGRQYFVALDLRPPGIWASWVSGHGPQIKPVMVFARIGRYKPRYDTDRVARAVQLDAYLARRMRYHIRNAAGV